MGKVEDRRENVGQGGENGVFEGVGGEKFGNLKMTIWRRNGSLFSVNDNYTAIFKSV